MAEQTKLTVRSPLVRLGNLFPNKAVYGKCEFLAPSGCFKIRGAIHLLDRLTSEGRTRQLVVPSMGNTAIGAAVGAREYGFAMLGVVPQTIARAKDEKLQALGAELVKIVGGGSALLQKATEIARERAAYFVHPHLDPLWTDGYQAIADEVFLELPDCRSLVFPVGGGGLLMGLTQRLMNRPRAVRLLGCEPYNYPKYAPFEHSRTSTIADGLLLETPHPQVKERITAIGIDIDLVHDSAIRVALAGLYDRHGLIVEPSSAIAIASVHQHLAELEEPICIILTGGNITREDFDRLMMRA